MLDRQTLIEKLESTQKILSSARGRAGFIEVQPQLNALLGAHEDLAAIILANDGTVLFAEPRPFNVPEKYRLHTDHGMWEWRTEEHTYELQSLMRTSTAVFC